MKIKYIKTDAVTFTYDKVKAIKNTLTDFSASIW